MAGLDLDRIRAETPGVAHRVHLNNAGAALPPLVVVGAVKQHLDLEAMIGGYEAADAQRPAIEAVYDSVARLIGAQRDEIALVENATVAWQMAFYSLTFQPGDRILTTEAEYGANYVAFLQVSRRTGAVIDVIPSDEYGETDVDALEAMLDERVKLIAVTWIPTNGGLVNPAARIGQVARKHGIPYLLDACQAAGQMPVDVSALGCDMLSVTGRKFLRGPRGTGFLYVRRSLLQSLEPPIIDHYAAPWVELDRYELRPDARRFENWENNYAARLGLGAAVDYALDIGLEAIQERAWLLADSLRDQLQEIPGVQLRDLGRQPCAIVSFSVEGQDATALLHRAREAGINLSTSSAASTLIDATKRELPQLLRASPHYYNTEAELQRLVAFIRRA